MESDETLPTCSWPAWLIGAPPGFSCPTAAVSERKSACPPAAVRVMDPDQADVFFVPVFSSLSLVVNPLSMVRKGQLGADAYDDVRMQVLLAEWGGASCRFPSADVGSMQGPLTYHAEAIHIIMHLPSRRMASLAVCGS